MSNGGVASTNAWDSLGADLDGLDVVLDGVVCVPIPVADGRVEQQVVQSLAGDGGATGDGLFQSMAMPTGGVSPQNKHVVQTLAVSDALRVARVPTLHPSIGHYARKLGKKGNQKPVVPSFEARGSEDY